MKKGYKYRIYPTVEQRVLLARTFGCARLVYNRLLDLSSSAYEAHKADPQQPKPSVSGYGHVYQLPALKEELPFLNDVSSVVLQQAAMDLGRAYQNFFKKRGKYPTFKSRRSRQSVRLTTSAFTIQGDLDAPSFYIAKSKSPIRVRWSRALPSSPSSVTISQEPDGTYYASFVCEYQPSPTNGDRVVGLDLGIKAFYHDSDNQTIEPPKYYRRAERRLARAQRQLSRKQKGSRNRHKARLKVAKLHAKTKLQRHDFLHKLSRQLVDDCKVIAHEHLTVSGMMRNRRLAKSITDLGWASFMAQLAYKAVESQWCTVVRIDRWYPSTQTCSVCQHRLTDEHKLTLRDRLWQCPSCHSIHDRDENAAINIRQEGWRIYEHEMSKGHSLDGQVVLGETRLAA